MMPSAQHLKLDVVNSRSKINRPTSNLAECVVSRFPKYTSSYRNLDHGYVTGPNSAGLDRTHLPMWQSMLAAELLLGLVEAR